MDQVQAGALRLATSAAIRNLGTSACPYPDGAGPAQSLARRVWFGEYLRRRPPVGLVDYDGDLDALAAGDNADADLSEAGEQQVPNVLLTVQEAMGPDGARLKRYWTKGKGAALIAWGEDGDFARCVTQLGRHVTDPEGLCNVYHQAAVGAPPGKGH